MNRKVSIIVHPARDGESESLERIVSLLADDGIEAVLHPTWETVEGSELLLVLGGDGSILRAAELARPSGVPILGINYGHVGFLSEADPEDVPHVVSQIVNRDWKLEERMTIDVVVERPDGTRESNWALNEIAIERGHDWRSFEVGIGVDGREISSFKADTVLFSTATGSTAYNFSAGGPIVWPDVEGMVLTPIAAHALFTRPLVVGPGSTLELYVADGDGRAQCDSRRTIAVPRGSTVRAVKGSLPVRLARLDDVPFSGRLVTKFQLPVRGWREASK